MIRKGLDEASEGALFVKVDHHLLRMHRSYYHIRQFVREQPAGYTRTYSKSSV